MQSPIFAEHMPHKLPKSTSDDSHLAGDSKQSENRIVRLEEDAVPDYVQVCFLPAPADRRPGVEEYIGCVGFTMGSRSSDGTWKTFLQIRSVLCPWVQDDWIRKRTCYHDRRMMLLPNRTLVRFNGEYLPRIGDMDQNFGDDGMAPVSGSPPVVAGPLHLADVQHEPEVAMQVDEEKGPSTD